MRISHKQLEECIRDPRAWIRERRSTAKRYFSVGYDQILLLGIYKYHGSRNVQEGRSKIDALFRKHARLNNQPRKDGVRERFQAYVDWCEQSRVSVVERRVTLDGSFGTFLTLGGHLHRVDGTGGGVRGIVLGDYPASWRSELRMPLIQLVLAGRYGLDAEAVSVGVQELDGSRLGETTFDQARLRGARQEFRAISAYVRGRWR